MGAYGRVVFAGVLSFLATACFEPLPHEGPFDSDAPPELQAKAALRGRLLLEGETDAGGIDVRLSSEERTYSYATANDGVVDLKGVVPGAYTLTLSTRYFDPVTETLVLPLGETVDLGTVALQLRQARVAGLARARIDDQTVVGGVQMVLKRIQSIRQASLGAAPGFRVAASVTDTVSYSTFSGSDGSWSVDGVDAGVYELSASQQETGTLDVGTVEVTGDGTVLVDEVLLTPLSGFVRIIGQGPEGPSEQYTRNRDVTLQLSGFNAEQMKIGSSASGSSADCVYSDPAVPYEAEVSYPIPAEGLHTVCVRYVDADGRETDDRTGSIFYDATEPGYPVVSINNGDHYTTDPQGIVTLTLIASEGGSGIRGYRLAPTAAGVASASLLPYEPQRVHIVDQPLADGLKFVWVSFYDNAGNFSTPVSASITLDRLAPVAEFVSASGPLVSSNIVPLAILVDDDVAEMQISEDPNFTNSIWQAFQPTITWVFPGVDGPVTLYGRFRDQAENESSAISIDLNIDTSPPAVGFVHGAVVNDTIVWEHLAGDVTGYTVELYDQGALRAATFTTETRLEVGGMHPGFSVRAHYADGTSSQPSMPPGYHVPATVPGLIGLRLDARSNALLARLAQEYGLGSTTTECGQVTFIGSTSSYYSDRSICGNGSTIRADNYGYSDTPPPFDAVITPVGDNPFAGISIPLRVSGGGYQWGGTGNAKQYMVTPGPLGWSSQQWETLSDVVPVISGTAYDPNTGTGRNAMTLHFPLAAMARTDDSSYSWAPFTDSTNLGGPIVEGTYTFTESGWFAGIPVDRVTITQPYWETFAVLNNLWDGQYDHYSSNFPGTLRFDGYMQSLALSDTTISIGDPWESCFWNGVEYVCSVYGTQYTLDVTRSTMTATYVYPPSWGSYWDVRRMNVANADGTRYYSLPVSANSRAEFYWRTESDQPVFGEILRRMVQRLAAPTRVRGAGSPLLRQSVAGASEMQVSTDGTFDSEAWVPYAAEITFAEGVQTVWIRYRDEAGNVTASREVVMASGDLAPQLDFVAILGAGANAGFTTTRNVTAYLLGNFAPGVRARFSDSPVYHDNGWQLVEPLTELVFTDPLTGKTEEAELDGRQVAAIDITLPETPGEYTYYFWLSDPSGNVSIGVPSAVLFDDTAPTAEFSVYSQQPGQIRFQAQWSVSRSSGLPSLTNLTPLAGSTIALPFEFPYYDATATTVDVEPGRKACAKIGETTACALTRFYAMPTTSYYASAQQAVIVWRSSDEYGIPVTAALTLTSLGNVRLSYWQTNARVDLAGHVNGVFTPYADWRYALVQGSVDYVPNPASMQFLVQTATGEPRRFTYRGTRSDPWTTVDLGESGHLKITGTAYSQAGARGTRTMREVVVPRLAQNNVSDVRAIPLSASRYWLDWRQDPDADTLLARAGNTPAWPGAQVRGRRAMQAILGLDQFHIPWSQWGNSANGRYFSLPESYRFRQAAALQASGARLVFDEEAGLAFGVDGSLWEMTDPYAPQPLKTYDGNYPFDGGSAVRTGDILWTTSGVYDVSDVQNPVRLRGAFEAGSQFAAYAGRVYRLLWSQVEIYADDASNLNSPAVVYLSTGSFGESPIMQRGRYILGYAWGQVTELDLADPDNPVESTYNPGLTHSYAGLYGEQWYGSWDPVTALGGMFVTTEGQGVLRAYTVDTNSEHSTPVYGMVNRISSAGPWLAASEPGKTSLFSLSQSLPAPFRKRGVAPYADIAADDQYFYVCSNARLDVYLHDWTLVRSGEVENCGKMNIVRPLLYMGSTAVDLENGFTSTTVEHCTEYEWGPSCNALSNIGSAFGGYGGVFATKERQSNFSDENCYALKTDEDRVYCNTGSDIYGTTLSSLRYAGIVTGPVTLPLVKLVDDEYFFDAGDGYLSTEDQTYRIRGLARAIPVGPGRMRFLGASLAIAENGTIYRLDELSMTPVAEAPVSYISNAAYARDGSLLLQDYGQVLETRWGPAAPELRYVSPDLSDSPTIAKAGGFVYVGGPNGIKRIAPPRRVAKADDKRDDVTVRHGTGGKWSVYDLGNRKVASVTPPPGATTDDLCQNHLLYGVLRYEWDPGSWIETVCEVEQTVPAADLFEGDIGAEYWAFGGYEQEDIGYVSSLHADTAGVVYAGVLTGTTGVYIYDSRPGLLAQRSFIATDPVVSLAAGGGLLYVATSNSEVHAYDLTAPGHPLVWTHTHWSPSRAVHLFDGEPYFLTQSTLTRLSRADGSDTGSCWTGGNDVEFARMKWSGEWHTLALIVGWSLSVYEFDPSVGCSNIGEWNFWPVGRQPLSITRLSGLFGVGRDDGTFGIYHGGLLTERGMGTILSGRGAIQDAVLEGRYAYTVGAGPLQIFELH